VRGFIYLNSLLPVITGYPAKHLCSAVFISHRDPDSVVKTELNFSFIRYADHQVNYDEKSVTSSFLWGKSKAVFREGTGCTLLRLPLEQLPKNTIFPVLRQHRDSDSALPWPHGNNLMDSVPSGERVALAAVADKMMTFRTYQGNAFAFLVVHHGKIISEKYAKGFNSRTRLLSWSMAKSFTNALAGIMVGDGLLNIHQPTGIPEWQNDGRRQITINHLLQMQSGLAWNEDYGNLSDVTKMLYTSNDFAKYAASKPLECQPGTRWYYSSGSTNIVNWLMRKKFGSDSACYAYSYQRLFRKIGMPDAVFETDPAGTQVGSSYIYATARDFARFGLLYLGDGVFDGLRILPEGWVTYTTTPASCSKNGYGSGFWVNAGKYYPAAPADMYSCNGHDGQRIFIIPSEDMVVVVLGYSPKESGGMNFNSLLGDILKAVKSSH